MSVDGCNETTKIGIWQNYVIAIIVIGTTLMLWPYILFSDILPLLFILLLWRLLRIEQQSRIWKHRWRIEESKCQYLRQELTNHRAQLQEHDQRKDEFLAMLGHELRNPLSPMMNVLHVMRRHNLPDPTEQWAWNVMARQVEHLNRLVADILDVSRFVRGQWVIHKTEVELTTVIAQAAETVQPFIEAQGQILMVAMPREPVYLEVDSTRLAQIVTNLLDNAAKYTPKQGHIWLSVIPKDNGIKIAVRDTGQGISAELLPRLFDSFIQGDPHVAGLGLGLAIVKRLVELHGGRITVHSPGIGQGSEFIIWLPANLPSQSMDRVREPPPRYCLDDA